MRVPWAVAVIVAPVAGAPAGPMTVPDNVAAPICALREADERADRRAARTNFTADNFISALND